MLWRFCHFDQPLSGQKRRGAGKLPSFRRKSRGKLLTRRAICCRRGGPMQHRESKNCCSDHRCSSRFPAPKAAGSVLAEQADNPVLSSYPDLQIISCRTAFSETSNDRLSPCAAASLLTVAVPFGICTRFPILSGSPTGGRSTERVLFTFGTIVAYVPPFVNENPG